MTGYMFQAIIALLLLFIGIKYIVTKDFRDYNNIYTEESKSKAAVIFGVSFIIGAILDGILAALMFQGIVSSSGNEGIPLTVLIPLIVLVIILLVFLIIKTKVLKKK